MVRHEAQNGENDKASVHAGRTVGDADNDAVSVCFKWGKKTKALFFYSLGIFVVFKCAL